ncbi:MAG: nitrous oxide-stimulated promoter family protein [Desulfuromonadaceae bacterium]|nr:nitrous oxide-stimulated promoter family protein [Desulfuromonadaceae bacterium]
MLSTTDLTPKEKKDLETLAWFTSVYCQAHHTEQHHQLDQLILELPSLQRFTYCSECREFLTYALARRLKCPLEEKVSCKHCPIHCYRPGHREKVREIMRYSGKTLIKRGRLDLLLRYLF